MSGIDINEHEAIKENIPDDLNSLAYSAYRIPDLKRRRMFSLIIFIIILLTIILNYFFIWLDFRFSLLILSTIAIYLYFVKSKMKIKQSEVIQNIGPHIDHSLGYYSTALTFRGLLLKPVWTVIIYDHQNPPQQRSIVEIDTNTGQLINDVYTENL